MVGSLGGLVGKVPFALVQPTGLQEPWAVGFGWANVLGDGQSRILLMVRNGGMRRLKAMQNF